MMKLCPMCGFRAVPAGSQTCGNSYCQEAGFYESRIKLFRRSATARERAVRLFQEKKDIAERASR